MFDEGARARVHFLVHRPDGLPELDQRELEAEVLEVMRTWDDELRDVLDERYGPAQGRMLAEAWLGQLPEHYRGYTEPETAAYDVGDHVDTSDAHIQGDIEFALLQ